MGAYIYTIGCIDAVNSWVNLNMIPVAAGAVGVAVVEVSLDLFHNHCKQENLERLSIASIT